MTRQFRLYSDGHVHICDPRVSEPISFAHVVDLHLHPEPSHWPPEYRSAIEWWDVEFDRPGSTVTGLLDRVRAFPADFVFFGGDMLDHYHPQSAERLVLLCAERNLDAYFQLGNHDWHTEPVRYLAGQQVTPDLRAEMARKLCEQWNMPGLYYSFERGDIRFLSLDTYYTKTSRGYEGYFDDAETEWLIDQLDYDGPIVVFSHVPFAMPGFDFRMRAVWGDIKLCVCEDENGKRVREALTTCPNLLGTFTGHLHSSSEGLLGEHCQFVTASAANGNWRFVKIANTPPTKSLRQPGTP